MAGLTAPAAGGWRRRFAGLGIRQKLLAMVLLPLLVVLPLLGLVLLWWADAAFDRMLIAKIRSDLAVANGYFERVLGEVGTSTQSVADSQALQQALAGGAPAVPRLLQVLRERERLDFLRLAPPGEVERNGVEVLAPSQFELLDDSLRARVAVDLVPTRNAAPTTRTQEDRAMVLIATRRVIDAQGRAVGTLQGGVLLNRNLPFIDHINAIVYPEGSLPFGSRGTATLFLDDVRISTNVRLFGPAREERAIGTRVSQQVRDHVLGQGETWLDRAFVVSDWYVSAYQPVLGGDGRRLGMLYVGYLEAPFTRVKYTVLAGIGAVFFAVMIAAAWVSLRWARAIFRPLEQMAATMQRVEAGALDARVGEPAGSDEIGRLAGHLDHLLDVIADNTRELQRWNAELDAKVVERTRALEDAQAHLVRSEKMAAVGQLTASIAHEVNNPIAVIQGNLDLLRELVGPEAAARAGAELRLIDAQVERMRVIVTQLLQFARPTEFAGYIESLEPARLLDDCLLLAGHQLARSRIEVLRDYRASRRVGINRQELQQVLVNLLVNAIHAMPDGGQLELAVLDDESTGEDKCVRIVVTDSGPGIAPDVLARLFQPFMTRKREGTGLGLWISRSLVERYGGDILAANREDGRSGAVFTVRLKAES